MSLSQPHGGYLVDLNVNGLPRQHMLDQYNRMVKIRVRDKVVADLVLLANGAYSPLTGFMKKKDYDSVLSDMRLNNGLLWSIPITLDLPEQEALHIQEGNDVALHDEKGRFLAVLTVEEKYSYDKKREAQLIYGTNDLKHPGVAQVYRQGDVLLGGPIKLVNEPPASFPSYQKSPRELRHIFKHKHWKTVTAFQTRNPIHRAHEYIQKCALEMTDGLLIHPLIGETKKDDVPADIRMQSYEIMLRDYYRPEHSYLSVFPAAMRYAGPREAIFHAICRKNYGCTHMIIGRDHAGVGDYYGTYEAQELIRSFTSDELGITPLCFEHAFYCRKCTAMATQKTCPHNQNDHVHLSGTKVREKLRNGESLPEEFTRPEVADVLRKAYQKRF